MLNTERRIAALEASAGDDSMKIVIVKDGETQVDALKRAGLTPGALHVACPRVRRFVHTLRYGRAGFF